MLIRPLNQCEWASHDDRAAKEATINFKVTHSFSSLNSGKRLLAEGLGHDAPHDERINDLDSFQSANDSCKSTARIRNR